MYTIAANLTDDGDDVENEWKNGGAPETSWSNADERKDIAGWLGMQCMMVTTVRFHLGKLII